MKPAAIFGITDKSTQPEVSVEMPPAEGDLRAQLREAQKLAVMGTTLAMIAHEYNNFFAPVVSYAQYALEKDDTELMRKTLRVMLQQYEGIRSMSDRVLGLARGDQQHVEAVLVRNLIEDAVACLGRQLSKDSITLDLQIDPTLTVRGNYNQLQQVFFNLVLNARQALLERGGKIRITATPLSDQRISIQVKDSGHGMKPDYLEKIFQPFFTTRRNESKREKRGIGLGLAVCKQIIEDHLGMIQAESIENSGTTITITLPAYPDILPSC
ncbi:MAG: Signal transduction histidine-protein kinase AtoS [Phycisphaerae bacterium]|nr:Signal transduction histidine-protein kinase AtoS [Phycisphaerae bacterium]